MQKTLAILLTLSLARSANRLFSKWTLQNWARNETWQPAHIVDVALNIRTNHGEPAVLIKNAGLAHYEMILDKPEAKIRQTFEDNTLSHFLTVK
ncbi:hypothetical protein N7533_011506 [Penicillium manginii]|uniref:uncharacterized protein n=1 Tax=Penicillium manginii TaxID=203109 RepID=UPI0025477C72|nr:uncharacterized protein N7533_011506 [Penicillium manginii]KAJ5742097.1 hypothetical protein N7533_011506 [Penicillium manginii]